MYITSDFLFPKLYNTQFSPHTLVARISRGQERVTLELTVPTTQTGLTECIVATLLLMSERSID
jgi:hypothetical protein